MCGQEKIRYVHIMEHKGYGKLNVGCICAEKMSNDYTGPKEREKPLRNRTNRRKKWLTREWKQSQKGNDYLNIRGHNIGTCRKRKGWSFWIDRKFFSNIYKTEEKAKLALFQVFEEMLKG